MDSSQVQDLEEQIEAAIAELFRGKRTSAAFPIRPTGHILEMMAKAATAVYEAAVEASKKHRN